MNNIGKSKIAQFLLATVLLFIFISFFIFASLAFGQEEQIFNKATMFSESDVSLPKVDAPIKEGKYKIGTSASGSRVLDIPGASKNAEARLNIYEHNGTNAQVFDLTVDKDGYYSIKNINSNLVLDVAFATAANSAKVGQYGNNGSKAQKGQIINAGGGSYVVKSALGQFVLDLNFANDQNGNYVNIYEPNNSDAQKWHFTPYNEDIKFCDSPIADGDYVLSTNAAPSRALDVNSGSLADCANIQIYEGNRTPAQTFNFVHDENGYYKITNTKSKLVVDLQGGQTANYSNVAQYHSNNSLAQRGIAVKNNNGTYTFFNALKKNLALDLCGASDSNGANVDVYEANGTNAQNWTLYKPEPTPGQPGAKLIMDGGYNIGLTSSNLVVDVPAASKAADTCLQLYERNDTLAQAFYFEGVSGSDTSGYYRIYIGCADGLAIGVKNNSILPYSEVVSAKEGKDDTLGSINAAGSSFIVCNKATGMYLSLNASIGKSGTKIVSNIRAGAKPWLISTLDLLDNKVINLSPSSAQSMVGDVIGGSRNPDTNIQLYKSNESLAQKFRVKKNGEDTYAIQSIVSGLWLGINSSSEVVQKRSASSNPSQDLLWKVEVNKGYYKFTHIQTNKVLDLKNGSVSSGTKLIVSNSSSKVSQKGYVKITPILSDGIYTIIPSKNLNKAIDIQYGSFSNNALAQIYEANGSGAQTFVITNFSDGTVDIRSARSKKYLDVKDGKAAIGSQVQQYVGNSTLAQRGVVNLTDDCYFTIASKLNTNLVIDCGSCVDGSQLKLAKSSGAQSQKFTFDVSDYPDVGWSQNCGYINQNPELPGGCESVALTELLAGVGYYESKTYIAAKYIPYSDGDFVHCYAGSPGNPPSGIGSTMPPCIATAGTNFLRDHGSRFSTNVATGAYLSDLIEMANAGYPSVVGTTIDLAPVSKFGQVLEGYQCYQNLHAVCLVGGDDGNVTVCDSLAGKINRPRSAFENVYNQAGKYAVTID